MSEPNNSNQLESLQQRLGNIAKHQLISYCMALGDQLGLFDALAAIGSEEHPAKPKEVADKADCKERYVKEWLGMMACADVIEVTEDEKFFIKPENKEVVIASAAQMSMIMSVTEPYKKLVDVYKKNGPLGLPYSDFTTFYNKLSKVHEPFDKIHLIRDVIPLIAVQERLEAGGLRILDVGCGNGSHMSLMAEKYPKCQFIGIDIAEAAIQEAKSRRNESTGAAFDNLEFQVMDASQMNSSWIDSFDLVLIFDACHDQMRPDLCLREIHRVLKSDGRFAMLEIKGTSSIYKDKQMFGQAAITPYSLSVLHCLPIASNSEDALGLGTAWGQVRAESMLREAGFSKVDIVETPFFPLNVLYISYK
ncbi:hypothetical protein WR25_25724 [Diploscapter pachys]|uniref:Uncharacterized protein n=1 Tax=Diploscapter pachys TaxID=2018661 RepID=A0A2A2KW34_9BILA|nr:hypothetical protein WR25_25724 [Diploscapter pachys]